MGLCYVERRATLVSRAKTRREHLVNIVVAAVAKTAFRLPFRQVLRYPFKNASRIFHLTGIVFFEGLDEGFHLDFLCGVFLGTLCVY